MEKELTLKGIVEADDEIEICTWNKKAGEAFKAGEMLLEVITGKENVEVSLETSGKLVKILKEECEIVSLDDPIAIIEAE